MNRLLVPLAAVLLAVATGCSNTSTAAGTTRAAAAEDADTVVATFGDRKITLAELDETIKRDLVLLERKYQDEKYGLRESSLEGLVVKELMEAEAKKRGMSEEDILKAEVEGKVPPATEEEIRAFYDAESAKAGGAGQPGLPPFEMIQDRIREYLQAEKQQKAIMAFFDRLKKDAGVVMTLARPAPTVEVAATGPSKGPADAPVTIVAFSDFQCPFCSRVNPTLTQVLDTYEDQVRLVFRDFPLPFHDKAQKAAEAGHCAAEQGKFWEMHDQMFANQRALDVPALKGYAKEVGVDEAKFDECLDGGKMAELVKKNMADGQDAGVTGTPAFFINGKMLSGALPFEEFKRAIDAELVRLGKAPAEAAAGG
ncbi:MAG TPA: thioredoxin domain-containing protein [Vulgatibacter sp.]|nr:thioredoxin domain-containing protein [Vulgatibacter sp.]